METRIICYLVGICCISVYSSGQIKEQARIDNIFAEWNQPDVPGCAVGIIENNELIFAEGYGIADMEPVMPDEFIAEMVQLKFNRLNDLISGFELDAGRVQNLKFEKR